MNDELRYFGYLRKSTDEAKKQILSIESQQFEMERKAQNEGLRVFYVFEESRSAKAPGRPIFNEMIRRIEEGEANAIVCWKLDRLARNFEDAGKIITLLQKGIIKEIRAIDRTFTSSDNVIVIAVEFGSANQYIRDLAHNAKRGHETKLRKGVWPGWAPPGYLNDKETRGIVVDPDRAPLVIKAFQLYATGDYTLKALRAKMNAAGLRTRGDRLFSVSNFQMMLGNPFYYGLMVYKKETYEGTHEPLVSKGIFEAVQEVMAEKSKPKSTSNLKPYLYRGLLRCGECGCFITTETQKSHNYLRCTKRVGTCLQKYTREEVVAEQIGRIVASVKLDTSAIEWMVAELEQQACLSEQATAQAVDTLRSEMASLVASLDRLLDLMLKGLLSEDEYLPKKQELLLQKVELRDKIAASERQRADRFEPVKKFLEACKYGLETDFPDIREENRDFFKKIGSNPTLVDQQITVVLQNPWKIAVEMNSKLVSREARSPFSAEKRKMAVWRRGWDSVKDLLVSRLIIH